MRTIEIHVSDETYDLIQQMDDRKKKGRIWLEILEGKKQLYFAPYQHNPTKRTMRTLYNAPFGSLYETVENIMLKLSLPKRVGLHRVADLLLGDAKESSDALHQMADSEQNNEPLNPHFNDKI